MQRVELVFAVVQRGVYGPVDTSAVSTELIPPIYFTVRSTIIESKLRTYTFSWAMLIKNTSPIRSPIKESIRIRLLNLYRRCILISAYCSFTENAVMVFASLLYYTQAITRLYLIYYCPISFPWYEILLWWDMNAAAIQISERIAISFCSKSSLLTSLWIRGNRFKHNHVPDS